MEELGIKVPQSLVKAVEDLLGSPQKSNKPLESTPAEAKGQETETTISGTTEPTRSREPETTTTVLEEEPGKGGGEGEAYSVGGTPEEPVIISHDNMQKLVS